MKKLINPRRINKESREKLARAEESLKEMQKILDNFKKKTFDIRDSSSEKWELTTVHYLG